MGGRGEEGVARPKEKEMGREAEVAQLTSLVFLCIHSFIYYKTSNYRFSVPTNQPNPGSIKVQYFGVFLRLLFTLERIKISKLRF